MAKTVDERSTHPMTKKLTAAGMYAQAELDNARRNDPVIQMRQQYVEIDDEFFLGTPGLVECPIEKFLDSAIDFDTVEADIWLDNVVAARQDTRFETMSVMRYDDPIHGHELYVIGCVDDAEGNEVRFLIDMLGVTSEQLEIRRSLKRAKQQEAEAARQLILNYHVAKTKATARRLDFFNSMPRFLSTSAAATVSVPLIICLITGIWWWAFVAIGIAFGSLIVWQAVGLHFEHILERMKRAGITRSSTGVPLSRAQRREARQLMRQ